MSRIGVRAAPPNNRPQAGSSQGAIRGSRQPKRQLFYLERLNDPMLSPPLRFASQALRRPDCLVTG